MAVADIKVMSAGAVKTMVAHIHGQRVERFIDTGALLATRDNRNEPAMKERLEPDLSKWLK